MDCIIRTISKTDYIIKIENEINIEEYIKNIMSNDIFHFINDLGFEYFINTNYIEGFKFVK